MRIRTLPQNRNSTQINVYDAREQWTYAGHFDPGFNEAVHAELEELLKLPANWDGYGAPQINPAIVSAAKNFVTDLPTNLAFRPYVVPMSPGNLQFEWHHGSKSLELEFENPTTIRFLQWETDTSTAEEGTFRLRDTEKAIDLIQWFMNGTCAV